VTLEDFLPGEMHEDDGEALSLHSRGAHDRHSHRDTEWGAGDLGGGGAESGVTAVWRDTNDKVSGLKPGLVCRSVLGGHTSLNPKFLLSL
jgi:hypothetical protein